MADIESSVALDISDARGAVSSLADDIRSELGGAFDDAIDRFASRLDAVDVAGTISEDLGAAAELFGESLRGQIASSADVLATGISDAAGVGAAQVGESLRAELSTATDGLAGDLGAAGQDGANQILTAGRDAVSTLSDAARTELGGALTDAAQQFSAALSGTEQTTPFQGLDLSGASQQLEDLAQSASDAADSTTTAADDFGLVEKAGGGISTAFQIAQGEAGGLTENLSRLSGSAGPVVGGMVAAGAATLGFATAGLRGVAAGERLDQVFGDLAPKLEHISVGGLNGDLDQLAVKAGSTSAPLKQVLADLGQFVQAGGSSQAAAAGIAEKFAALDLRAIALKPSLGDAGTAGQRLFTALASGRDRALIPFALGIDQAQVKSEALKLGLISTIDQALTPYQRVIAGVTLATEKAGNALGTQFSEGAQQAATRAKALRAELEQAVEKLGEPLVEPLLRAGTALVPVAESIGKLAALLVSALIPAIDTVLPALQAVGTVAEFLTQVLGSLGPVLPIIVGGFLAWGAAGAIIPRIMEAIAGGVGRVVGTIAALRGVDLAEGGALSTFSAGLGRVAQAAPLVAAGLAVGVSSMHNFGETTAGTLGTVGGFAVAGTALGTAVLPGLGTAIGAVAGTVTGLTVGLIAGGTSVDDYREKFAKLGSELDQFNAKQATTKFIKDLGTTDAFGLAAGKARALTDELKALASTSPAAAEKVVAGLKQMRDESGKPLFNHEEAAKLDAAVRSGTTALTEANAEKTKAQTRNQELTQSSQNVSSQLASEAAAQKKVKDEIASMVDVATKALPDVGKAFSDAQGFAQSFTDSIKSAASDAFSELQRAADQFGVTATPEQLLGQLNNKLVAVQVFENDLLTILQSGSTQTAQLLAKEGPEAGGTLAAGLAQAIRDGNPEVAKAIEETVNQISGIDKKMTDALSLEEFERKLLEQIASVGAFGANLGTLLASGFAGAVNKLKDLGPEKGGEIAQTLVDAIESGHPEVAQKFQDLLSIDQATKDKFRDDFAGLAPAIREGAKQAVDAARTGLAPLPQVVGDEAQPGTDAGEHVGSAIVTGVSRGLGNIVGDMGKTISDTVDRVRQKQADALFAGHQVGDAATSGVEGGTAPMPQRAADAVARAAGRVADAAGGFFLGGFSAGQAAAAGIEAGIQSVTQDIVNAAVTVGNAALAGVRAAFRIHSPSQVFADEVGRPIAQGIALGISQGKADVQRSIIDAVGPDPTAIQARVADVTGQARIGSRPAQPSDFAAPVVDHAAPKGDVNYITNIDARGNSDADAIARANHRKQRAMQTLAGR